MVNYQLGRVLQAGQHEGLLAEVSAQLDGEQVVLLLSEPGEDSVGVVVLPSTTMISFASLRLTSTEAMPGSPLCAVTVTEMTGWAAVLPAGETGLPLLAASSVKLLRMATLPYRHQARLSERLRYQIHMPIEE
jgi:hypothetical protein